jgi:hypothetical protein
MGSVEPLLDGKTNFTILANNYASRQAAIPLNTIT